MRRSSSGGARPPFDHESGLWFFARPTSSDMAIAFVHGLGADAFDGWGTQAHPGAFIRRTWGDLPEAAIAVFRYPSGLKRFAENRALGVETLSRHWAWVLREQLLSLYPTVIVVAHCLGGLLTTMALRHLVTERDAMPWPPHAEVVVFLLDAPHDVPEAGPDDWLAGLLEALSLDPAALHANAVFWEERILARGAEPIPIQAYAVTSEPESWVTPMRPGAGLSAERVSRMGLSHTELAKAPAEGAFAPYDFVYARIRECLARRASNPMATRPQVNIR